MISTLKVTVIQKIECDFCSDTTRILSDRVVDVGERAEAVQLPERWRMVVQHLDDGQRTHVVCPRHQVVVRDWNGESHYVERQTFPGGFIGLREVGLDSERPSLVDGGAEAKPAWTRRVDPYDFE